MDDMKNSESGVDTLPSTRSVLSRVRSALPFLTALGMLLAGVAAFASFSAGSNEKDRAHDDAIAGLRASALVTNATQESFRLEVREDQKELRSEVIGKLDEIGRGMNKVQVNQAIICGSIKTTQACQ